MFRMVCQCQFVSLQSHIFISHQSIHIPHIIPHITEQQKLISRIKYGSFEARVEEMVLMVGKTTQCHVIPYLWRLITKFNQPLIQFECNLRLFFIETVCCDISHCFDVTIFHRQCLFIVFVGCFQVVDLVIYSPDSYIQFRLESMHFLSILQYRDRFLDIVLFLVYFAKIQKRIDIVVVLH